MQIQAWFLPGREISLIAGSCINRSLLPGLLLGSFRAVGTREEAEAESGRQPSRRLRHEGGAFIAAIQRHDALYEVQGKYRVHRHYARWYVPRFQLFLLLRLWDGFFKCRGNVFWIFYFVTHLLLRMFTGNWLSYYEKWKNWREWKGIEHFWFTFFIDPCFW